MNHNIAIVDIFSICIWKDAINSIVLSFI